MTGVDLYTPEAKLPSDRRFNNQTMSQLMKPTGGAKEVKVMDILGQLGVSFRYQEPFERWNEWVKPTVHGADVRRLKTYTPDYLIVDPQYYCGIMEVEGKGSASKENPERDAFFTRQGLWVEHIANGAVNLESIKAILARHEMKLDDYGGAY